MLVALFLQVENLIFFNCTIFLTGFKLFYGVRSAVAYSVITVFIDFKAYASGATTRILKMYLFGVVIVSDLSISCDLAKAHLG